jgi:hypothetical protein
MSTYNLRAVKGNELERIMFDADNDRYARHMALEVLRDNAPDTELWREGKIVAVNEGGQILHTFQTCDNCNQYICDDDDCGGY